MLAILACGVVAGGCGGRDPEPRAAGPAPERGRPAGTERAAAPARCPAGLEGCRTASGRIVYVEAVDPDGDGDAHFVLASRESVTAPGVSVIDVGPRLRPDPLPGVGDRISAAGPVFRGSHGQRQIEAVQVRVGPGG